MHHFLLGPAKRQQWLKAVKLTDLQDHTCICSHDFPHGNVALLPSLSVGKCFASPKKLLTAQGKRAVKCTSLTPPFQPPDKHQPTTPISSSCSSQPVTHVGTDVCTDDDQSYQALSTSIGEPLLSDLNVHELAVEVDTTHLREKFVVNTAFVGAFMEVCVVARIMNIHALAPILVQHSCFTSHQWLSHLELSEK